MGDCMNYPETIEEFIKQYSFKDTEEIYTNGAELIPVFRVMQAIEHYIKEWQRNEFIRALHKRDTQCTGRIW